jgi:hypothetical protein
MPFDASTRAARSGGVGAAISLPSLCRLSRQR